MRSWTSRLGSLQTTPHSSRESGGQFECQLPALGLAQYPARIRDDGMKLHLRERPLEAQDEPPVYGGRIVNAVVVGNKGLFVAADVQKRVPVRAVALAGDLRGEDDSYPTRWTLAVSSLNPSRLAASEAVNPRSESITAIGSPAQPSRAFFEGVL